MQPPIRTEHTRPSRPSAPERHPAASPAARVGAVPDLPPRKAPGQFEDDPTRAPLAIGTAFVRLAVVPRSDRVLELEAELATSEFTGRGRAVFRGGDLAAFIAAARGFTEGRSDAAALQGGAFDEDGRLRSVAVGLHATRPHDRHDQVGLRVVIASGRTDDLMTATLRTTPLMVAQFADQLDAIAHRARDQAMLIGL